MKTRKYKVKGGIGGSWVTLQGKTKREVQAKRDREGREALRSIAAVGSIGVKLLLTPDKKKRTNRYRDLHKRK